MRRTVVTIGLLFFSSMTEAQSLRSPVSSSYQLINAYSAVNSDAFSFTSNTAALSRQEHFAIGAFAENRFSLNALNGYSVVGTIATDKGNFGVQADYFGYSKFNEYQLGFAYARSLGSALDIGAQFNYFGYQIPAYGQNNAVTFQIGAIARLSEVVNVGLQVYNPVGGYISKKEDEKLAANYQFAVSYEPTGNVIVTGIIEKEEQREVSFIGGIFYQFDKRFFARIGVKTAETTPFAAAGILFDDLRLDISVSHHPQLGFSPGLRVIYEPKKIRDD